MDPLSLSRVALPLLLASFAGVLLVWPGRAAARGTGVWAVTLHRSDARQSLMGLVFLALVLGLAAGRPLRAVRAAAIGVWSAPRELALAGLLLAARACS
jgi:hypothetical protein